MSDTTALGLTGLVDLASEALGGQALGASDEFFAGKENLLQPGRGVFIPGEYTERGKWMDGWESRRKRGPGHDSCIVPLGVRGVVKAVDIDTHHFSGNQPPFASVEGLDARLGAPLGEVEHGAWKELVAQGPLLPSSQNLFVAEPSGPFTHLRLNIFPDGGVARFRAYGSVVPDFSRRELDDVARARVRAELVDLVALANGGRALACSDARFGAMNQLILPGRARNMSSGWETRRNRGGTSDWLILQLAARGTLSVVEVDTAHFIGNFPDRCALDVLDLPNGRITDLITSSAWLNVLPETPLSAHDRHFFGDLRAHGAVSHARLTIYPDGGVSRLRLWGTRDG